jgi:hypothetical protein
MNSFFHGYYSLKFLPLGQSIFSQMPGISLCCIQEINSENGYFIAEAQRGTAASETRMGMSRAKLAKHVLSKVEGSPSFQKSPSFPLCQRGMKGSPSFPLCQRGMKGSSSFPLCQRGMKGDFWIALRQTDQIGGMNCAALRKFSGVWNTRTRGIDSRQGAKHAKFGRER